jgi:hypothetical protein
MREPGGKTGSAALAAPIDVAPATSTARTQLKTRMST